MPFIHRKRTQKIGHKRTRWVIYKVLFLGFILLFWGLLNYLNTICKYLALTFRLLNLWCQYADILKCSASITKINIVYFLSPNTISIYLTLLGVLLEINIISILIIEWIFTLSHIWRLFFFKLFSLHKYLISLLNNLFEFSAEKL